MKKKLLVIILLILYILILLKYNISSYEINYKIGKYNITEKYVNKKYIYEINKEHHFVIDFYEDRKLSKKLITDIKEYKKQDYICYKVIYKNMEDSLTCFEGEESISPYLIKSQELLNELGINELELKSESNDFKFYNNLDKNTFIALWNYKGYYIMNGEDILSIDIFKNTKYDNSLSVLIDENIILPDYDKEHEFKNFKKMNLKTGNIETIESKYTIDYDSYVSGINKKMGYIFDNKYSKLYEINTRKNNVTEIGNEKKGFIKIENNKKVNATKKEYAEKITYFEKYESNYIISDNLYRVYNKNYKVKIFDSNEVTLIKEFEDKLYFLYKDDLYLYNNGNIEKILHYFELNFNSKNMIFIYME